VEQAQVGVGGVDVDPQQSGDVLGRVARRAEQHRLQASALPRLQGLLQQAMKPVAFLRRGGTYRQGAGHGLSSSSAPLFHSNNPLVTHSYNLHVTPRLRERVGLVFQRINQALLKHIEEEPACAGMGTTLTGAYTVGPEAFVAHVGDSRAYLFHDGKLTQLTRDHTLAQQCLDAGLPVACRSWYHLLTNYLGSAEPAAEVDFHHFRLGGGDQLLLCTDGLTNLVRNEEVADILGRHTHPQETAQALVDLALERGGKDNVTVVLAQYAVKGVG
jgi:protein phosphatase